MCFPQLITVLNKCCQIFLHPQFFSRSSFYRTPNGEHFCVSSGNMHNLLDIAGTASSVLIVSNSEFVSSKSGRCAAGYVSARLVSKVNVVLLFY